MTDYERIMAASRGDIPPALGHTISGLIQENLTECHVVLNVLGIPPSPEGFSLDGGLAFRLKLWLAGHPVSKGEDND